MALSRHDKAEITGMFHEAQKPIRQSLEAIRRDIVLVRRDIEMLKCAIAEKNCKNREPGP